MLQTLQAKVIAGEPLHSADLTFLMHYPVLPELLAAAHAITRVCAPQRFDACSIINAKCGRCSEDCRWCAQAGRYHAVTTVYPLIDKDRCLQAALACERQGIHRFSLVTGGKKPTAHDFASLLVIIKYLKENTSLSLCASLGLLSLEQLAALKEAGLERCHCNLESSASFFPQVCTTHSYQEKIAVLQDAQAAGLSVCSGGIIGMGESMDDRVQLAQTLRQLQVDSVPLNLLQPIAGTPLAKQDPLSEDEILRTIALFRFILPHAYLRLAGGRRQLTEEVLRQALYSGINAAIVGDFLTTSGATFAHDKIIFAQAGYAV